MRVLVAATVRLASPMSAIDVVTSMRVMRTENRGCVRRKHRYCSRLVVARYFMVVFTATPLAAI